MELMLRIVAASLVAVVLAAVLRRSTPELAVLLAVAAGGGILAAVGQSLGAVVQLMEELAARAGLSEVLLEPVAKTVALSVLTKVTAEICRSAGEGGIASFVETAGAALALVVAVPLVRAVALLMGEMLG